MLQRRDGQGSIKTMGLGLRLGLFAGYVMLTMFLNMLHHIRPKEVFLKDF